MADEDLKKIMENYKKYKRTMLDFAEKNKSNKHLYEMFTFAADCYENCITEINLTLMINRAKRDTQRYKSTIKNNKK